MSIKKFFSIGLLMGLAAVLSVSGQDRLRRHDRGRDQDQLQTRDQDRLRTRFMDQNGDGVNDLIRDHDNDGVPNCQDPDWKRPQDGTGFKSGQGRNNQEQGRHAGWNNRSFRGLDRLGSIGSGICDGSGPKGRGIRRGR
jgi:hypothetical protein